MGARVGVVLLAIDGHRLEFAGHCKNREEDAEQRSGEHNDLHRFLLVVLVSSDFDVLIGLRLLSRSVKEWG